MHSICKKIVFMLLMGISVLFAIINIRSIADKKVKAKLMNQYSCVSVEEGMEVTFYSSTGEIIFTECYSQEPAIRQVTDNIYEVRISVGSPAAYIFYVDVENAKLSETYFNALYFGERCVAYMEDGQLILRDLYDREALYISISRDFSKTANPMSAIISIEMQEGKEVVLSYYQGEDYEEKSEIITLY